MAKTKEELNELKTEYEALTTKLSELSEEEFELVAGGTNEYDEQMIKLVGHGKNGKPTLPLWDEASAGLIIDGIPLDSDEKLKS